MKMKKLLLTTIIIMGTTVALGQNRSTGMQMSVQPGSCEWVAAKSVYNAMTKATKSQCQIIGIKEVQEDAAYDVAILCISNAKYAARVYVSTSPNSCYLAQIPNNPIFKKLN